MSEATGEETLAGSHGDDDDLADVPLGDEQINATKTTDEEQPGDEEDEDNSLSLWDRFKARAEKEVEQQRLEEERQKKLMEELRRKREKEEADEEAQFQAELDRREAERKRVLSEKKRKREESTVAIEKTSTAETSAARASEWSSDLAAVFGSRPPENTDEEILSLAPKKRKEVVDNSQSSIVLQFKVALHPKIVGRAGGTITKIRQTSCADVKVNKKQDYCEVTISGKTSSVQKAKQMIIDQAGEQPTSTSGETATASASVGQKTSASQPSKDVQPASAEPLNGIPTEREGHTAARNEDVEMKEATADSGLTKLVPASANGDEPILAVASQTETVVASLGKVDVVVKIGGSACTKKAQFETLNEVALNASATQLSDFAKESGCSMAIIHGAGSFGHQQAKEFGVSKGQPDGTKELSARLSEGFAKTRLSVKTLNLHVVKALIEEGLPAVGISPCPFVSTEGKKLLKGRLPPSATNGVRSLLEARLVPVVHGDAVLDETQACAILSGDVWMVELCREFSARSAVFITDVDGVFNKPPNEPDAELIRDIWVNMETGELDLGNVAVSQAAHDVTGGLSAKLKCAAEVLVHAPHVQAVYIVKAGSESVAQAIRGETPKDGTTLRRRAR